MTSNQIIYSIAIPVGACAIAGVTMLVLYNSTLPPPPLTRDRSASDINTGVGNLGDPNDIMVSLGGKRRRNTRSKRPRSHKKRR